MSLHLRATRLKNSEKQLKSLSSPKQTVVPSPPKMDKGKAVLGIQIGILATGILSAGLSAASYFLSDWRKLQSGEFRMEWEPNHGNGTDPEERYRVARSQTGEILHMAESTVTFLLPTVMHAIIWKMGSDNSVLNGIDIFVMALSLILDVAGLVYKNFAILSVEHARDDIKAGISRLVDSTGKTLDWGQYSFQLLLKQTMMIPALFHALLLIAYVATSYIAPRFQK